ncbi:MAG TPA: helix-turn-helix domain-containing protein [Candidatus Nanoarchaeia archaeon]|nr:helix-turn-helix domain-containing protein [Candidatus Nanoarchaeia archaeon]
MEKLADTRILEHVGLTRNESRVYIELLRAGSSLARDIARLMNMHRTSVYSCLERLQKKGLVSVTNLDKKTYFEAVDPNKLVSLLKEREERLKSVLPELKKLKDSNFYTKHEVQYFKGKQGLKSVFDEILSIGESYVGWGPERKIESLLKYYFMHYIETRKQRKIHAKLIYFENSRGEQHTKTPLVKIRYLPKTFYQPTAHRVYGDNVAILLLEENPLCIIIRNNAIAESYRKHFDILWKMAKK